MGQRYFGNKHGGNTNVFYPQEYPSTWTLITQDEVTFEAKNKSMKKTSFKQLMSDPALDQTVNFYTHLRHGDIQIMAIWYLSISISKIERSIDGFV